MVVLLEDNVKNAFQPINKGIMSTIRSYTMLADHGTNQY